MGERCGIGPALRFAAMDPERVIGDARVFSDAALGCCGWSHGGGACNPCRRWAEDRPDLAVTLGL